MDAWNHGARLIPLTPELAATLRALNYGDMIEAKHGELQGDLRWSGGFGANMLERAAGTISVHAETGQLVAVQPGAGRVLGLFSVAALALSSARMGRLQYIVTSLRPTGSSPIMSFVPRTRWPFGSVRLTSR